MPIVEGKQASFTNFTPIDPEPEPIAPNFGTTLQSAFRLNNDVLNLMDLMGREEFPRDPKFNLNEKLRTEGLEEQRDNFIGVFSEPEFNSRRSQIYREQQDRANVAAAGWPGIVASMGAGITSPTVFLPLTTYARGLKAVGAGAGLGLFGVGSQEMVLQAAQQTRTPEESALTIATGTFLGAILGGAASHFRPGETMVDVAKRMDANPGQGTVSYAYGRADVPVPLGAEVAEASRAGGLKPALSGTNWFQKQVAKLGPITRGLTQDFSEQGKWMTAQFGTAGLRLEGNANGVASAQTGTIEHSRSLWDANMGRAIQGFDKEYNNYYFDDAPPTLFPNTRAEIGGMVSNGKISRREFAEAVGNAFFVNDEHANPYVARAAAHIRKELYDPMHEEAMRLKVYELSDTVDESYLNRLYDENKIMARFADFVEVLGEHVNSKYLAEFNEDLGKLLDKQKRAVTEVEDINRPIDEVEELRAEYEARLEALEAGRSEELAEGEEAVASLREKAAAAKKSPPRSRVVNGTVVVEPSRGELLTEARNLEELLGEPLKQLKADRAEIRRRLKQLNKNRFVVGEKYAAKLAKVDRLEELQLRSMDRVIKKAEKVSKNLEKYSSEQLQAKAEELRGQFNELAEVMDRGDEKLRVLQDEFDLQEYKQVSHKLFYGDRVPNPNEPDEALVQAGLKQEALQETRAARLERLSERLDETESLDDDALRDWIADALQEVKKQVNDLNSKRAVRRVKLAEGAKKLAPEATAERIAKIQARQAEREGFFSAKYQPLGDYDAKTGTADFSAKSKDVATEVAHRILGTHSRIQGLHMLLEARGPELARTLDIPSTYVSKSGKRFADFLVTDIQKAARAYGRTLAADIEITRKFGSPDAKEAFLKLTQEYNAQVDALAAEGKDSTDISKKYLGLRYDLEALMERTKNERGIPKDPASFAARAGRTMMNMNVLRFMGSTLLSSIPDVSRPIMKYGLTRTFRDGFQPMIGRLKKWEIAKREAKLAGIGMDTLLHTRALQIYDMVDDFSNRSKFERGMEWASTKMGGLALFDRWTDWMKELTSSIAITKMSDAIGIVAGGAKASKKETAEAVEFLAASGIDPTMARAIWDEMLQPGGADEIDGVLIPNTEAWTNRDAIRAFRSALRGEADDTIITPGFERPLWMDNTLPGRMVAQFRSFAMSSTTKTLMAGLQARDSHFVTGVVASMAFGMMSYYLWAVATGGRAYEEMINAGPDKWADEAIARSGVLAVFGEFQRIAERIPLTSKFATFSGRATTNRAGDSLVEAIAGPSFDMADRGAQIVMGLDQPTQSTLHALRTLVPFQNMFYLRQAFDVIERNSGLPEERERQ